MVLMILVISFMIMKNTKSLGEKMSSSMKMFCIRIRCRKRNMKKKTNNTLCLMRSPKKWRCLKIIMINSQNNNSCNYNNNEHLFVDCSFANKVWTLILQGLKAIIPTKILVVDLFLSWKDRYPLSSLNSSWARIWITIPKFVCWKLWLARN